MQPVAPMLPPGSPLHLPPRCPGVWPPSTPSSKSEHPVTPPSQPAWSSPSSLTGPSAFSGFEKGKDKQNVEILQSLLT